MHDKGIMSSRVLRKSNMHKRGKRAIPSQPDSIESTISTTDDHMHLIFLAAAQGLLAALTVSK